MGIEEIRETIESCKHCYMCRHACPTFLATKLDSNTPRGYALLLSEIDHGFQCWTPTIVDRFYQCTQCGLCREDCAYHWAEDEVVRNGREEIVLNKHTPDRVRAVAERIMKSGSLFENLIRLIEVSSATIEKKKADILYFAGCSTREHHQEIVSAVDKILGALKISWTVIAEEVCCGTPLWELGYSEAAKKIAEETAKKIRSLNPKILLTSCPHCARTFSELYPKWGVKLPDGIQIMHTSTYFYMLFVEGMLSIETAKMSQVSYHDPCQLGRKLGEYDAPRELIKATTGFKPLELLHSRQNADCCGAGSVMFLTDPQITKKIAKNRMDNALDTESNLLITSCQNCKRALTAVSFGTSIHVEVRDLVEIIAERI